MSAMFEELDYRVSRLGALSLRRRRNLSGGEDIYEIILGDAYLMSSRFIAAEVELARIGLARCSGSSLDVVVGGLGLGYTAQAVLEHPQVRSLLVVDSLPEIIEWHRTGLLPLGPRLTSDPRCQFALGNFFELAGSEDGFDAARPGRKFAAILVDIDHSPSNLLHPDNAGFYSIEGMGRMKRHLVERGVFALWSNDPPDEAFVSRLEAVFTGVEAEVIEFAGLSGRQGASNTIYSAIAG